MRYIFAELIRKRILILLFDDGVILAKTFAEALDNLRKGLEVAAHFGLNINWKKCQLLQTRVEFLGHIVEDEAIWASSDKTAAISNYIEPRTEKQLQRFLGLASYFRKFIRGYAKIAKLLSDLLKQERRFTFGEKQQAAFHELRCALTKPPGLQLYRQTRETEQHTDASKDGYGAILLQWDEKRENLHPIYYMSRKTTSAEEKYRSYELEFSAVIKAIEKFRKYLLGISFTVVTDCAAFEATMQKKELTPRIGRWITSLSEYTFKTVHSAGTSMRHVDAFSRVTSINLVYDGLNSRLSRAQARDDKLKALKALLEKEAFKDHKIKYGLVFKGSEGNEMLVVPRRLQHELIRRAHEVGHFGTKKTVELLSREYFIEKLDKRINEFIQNCLACILGSRKAGKQEGILRPIPKGETPLHTLHLNYVGPLNETKKKYNHILVIIDGFTKYVWLFPTKSTGTKETPKKIRVLLQHFGNPDRVVTDRGPCFIAGAFDKFCQKENVHHLKITAGIPRGNEQLERVNSTVKGVLTKINVMEPTK